MSHLSIPSDLNPYNLGINFGRYVDDFRVFTNNKSDSLKVLIILQEFLLKIGLNLNTSKTKIIEAQEQIIKFIKHSNKSGIYGMPCQEESSNESQPEKKLDKTQIIKEIDSKQASEQYEKLYFLKYPKKVIKINDIDDEDKAKKFCVFLNGIKLGAKLENQAFSQQMESLYILSKKYPKHWSYYSWLWVKFISQNYSNDIQNISLKYLFKVFDDELVNVFIKTRIIHHLVNSRKGGLPYIERIGMNQKLRNRIIEHITKLMKINCIALQLNCIYAYYLMFRDRDHRHLQDFVSHNLKRPIPKPIQQAVYQIGTLYENHSPGLASFEEILEESEIEYESEDLNCQ